MPIAVTGCLREMQASFPDKTPENAGNMIHANAPFEMFSDAVYSDPGDYAASGRADFREFVNQDCSHLVVTVANFIRVGDEDGEKYANFHRYLEQFDVPLVIFGIGAQSKSSDTSNIVLPTEARDLLQFLGERSRAISVRGEYTASVFKSVGVENTFVTGCPSFYSRPSGLEALRENLGRASERKNIVYSGTVLHEEPEQSMLYSAISAGEFLIEPVNQFNHGYHLSLTRGEADPEVPWFLRAGLRDGAFTAQQLRDSYTHRYRLFRNTKDWYRFNEDVVDATYGSRFHVNMASILSGTPATWVTHDSRTRELVDHLHLPSVPLDEAKALSGEEITSQANYEQMFDSVGELFGKFNEFLVINGLPRIRAPFESLNL